MTSKQNKYNSVIEILESIRLEKALPDRAFNNEGENRLCATEA